LYSGPARLSPGKGAHGGLSYAYRQMTSVPTPLPRRLACIINPFAGTERGLRDEFEALKRWLQSQGIAGLTLLMLDPAELEEMVRLALDWGAEEFWIGGGDGTLARFAGLHHRLALSHPTLFLPMGTACQLARRLHIPLDFPELFASRPHYTSRLVDLYVTRSGFTGLLAAGIGMDARAMARVNHGLKRVIGEGAYYQSLLQSLFTMQPFQAVVEWEGGQWSGSTVEILLANANPFEGPLASLVPQATITDGLLDVMIFRAGLAPTVIKQIASFVTGPPADDPDIVVIRTPWVKVRTDGSVPVQVDGDVAGFTPLEIRMLPAAFPLLQPAS